MKSPAALILLLLLAGPGAPPAWLGLSTYPACYAAGRRSVPAANQPLSRAAQLAAAGTPNTAVALGLDPRTLKLVNRGEWKAAAEQLEKLTTAKPEVSRAHAWLAFAYLFLGRCDDLGKLAEKVAQRPDAADKTSQVLVTGFALTCQGKLAEAEKALEALPDSVKNNDPLVNFCLAAVAGKKGEATRALAYCEKTVDLAPNFAWGDRTLGYLEDRWLKDPLKAEAAFEKALAVEPDFKEVRDMLVDSRLTRNNFDGAIDVARDGIEVNRKDATNYHRLAQIYIQQWRLREALDLLKKSVALSPDDARFHRAMASILRYQGNLNEAIAAEQKAVECSKDKAFELIELAALNVAAGNANRAADNLREAIKLKPDNEAAFQKLVQLLSQEKRWDDLVGEYKGALERKPKDAALRLGLARALKSAGKLDEAISEFTEAANLNQLDPQPHRELGAIYVEKKEHAKAAKEYTRALNINPSSVDDLVALGYCYAQNDDYLQAETAFVTAIALQQLTQMTGQPGQTNIVDVMRSLSVLFLAEGRYSESCTQLEAVCASPKASGLDRFLLAQAKVLRDRTGSAVKDMQAAYDKLDEEQKNEQKLALVETLLKVGRTEQASAILDQVPQAQLDADSQWLVARARAYRLAGDLAKGEEIASRAVSLKDQGADKQSDAYLELAQVVLAKGDAGGAEPNARKAIEQNSKSFAAYEILGRVYQKKGEPKEAVEAGKKALEINPYYTPAYLLVGDAQSASGQLNDASNYYKKAVELYPGLLEAHKSLLAVYQKLALKEEAKKEAELIAQIEKRE